MIGVLNSQYRSGKILQSQVPTSLKSYPSQQNTICQPSLQNPLSFPSQYNEQSKVKIDTLGKRLQAIGGGNYGVRDTLELCVVLDIVILPKFKVPEFEKYRGTTCPRRRSHVIKYCRKMASYIQDDKLLIHFFQDSLIGAALNWYMHLKHAHICWW